jgi:nucleotide-binding universal stress UspA family protein
MFQKLLVPLDGTPYAAAALPLARGNARGIGAEIVLLRVAPTGRAKEAGVAAAEYLDRDRHGAPRGRAEGADGGLPW